jgi:hypothetical protein
MKMFHISDVLSATTKRLVSSRGMDGIYEILNFIIGDNLFTNQLPRAMDECEPWLRAQFPQLFPDNPLMMGLLSGLDSNIEQVEGDRAPTVARWVEAVRTAFGLPENLPVYELGAGMHTRIDPIEEAEAMVGKGRVIAVDVQEA